MRDIIRATVAFGALRSRAVQNPMPLSRRFLLKSAASTAALWAAGGDSLRAQAPQTTTCDECGGVGFLPLRSRKPYVHIEGQPAPRGVDGVPYRFCPKCQANRDASELVEQQLARHRAVLDAHKKWEQDTGFELVRIETRHIVVHSQLPASEATKIGQAFETLTTHLQELTGSVELTPTRPDSYEQMCLASQDAYEHFREVMEKRHTQEQLGEMWSNSRGMTAFDHVLIPFFYEDARTIKRRPPAHAVCFFGGRKQLIVATESRGPRWLYEGFAEYCEFAALKRNLWCAVYNQNEGPEPGNWVPQLRQLAVKKELRPWPEQMSRELRNWNAKDYLQVFGMARFLLTTAPKSFLAYARSLKSQPESPKLLEEAYKMPLDQLEAECNRWILSAK